MRDKPTVGERAQSAGAVVARVLLTGEEAEWGRFLRQHDYSAYHTIEWLRVLKTAYGFRPLPMVAVDAQNAIRAVLPLMHVRVTPFHGKVISVPHQMCAGGILAGDARSEDVLLSAAVATARALRARYIEVRGPLGGESYVRHGFREQQLSMVEAVAPLDHLDIGRIWKGHRLDVRKAEKSNAKICHAENLSEWRSFYELLELQMREFGSPGYGWTFFKELFATMRDRATIILAKSDGVVTGGVLLLCGASEIHYKQGVVRTGFHQHGLGKLLIWEAMNWGASKGFRRFNFGITPVGMASLIRFKEGWGAQTRPIKTLVCPITGSAPDFGEYYAGYQWQKAVWSKMPIAVTKILGHMLCRWFC